MKRLLFIMLLLPSFTDAQIITTIAGGGVSFANGIPATACGFTNPSCLAFDKFGNLYVSDQAGGRVRKIDASGTITTVAGSGGIGPIGDGGPATAAYLFYPEGIACDTSGNLYIADHMHFRVRKVDVSTGIISTFAGTGTATFTGTGDGGPATGATFYTPCDVKFDRLGNLYVADNSAGTVRKINALGTISTVAGIGDSLGFLGDGGLATAARLHDPTNLALDSNGVIYIADGLNKRVRKIDTFGIITTVAGTGVALYSGDGVPATAANVGPIGIALFNNTLYITDSNQRVRSIDPAGIIHTVAGTGLVGYSGDGGPATDAKMFDPGGIVSDICGDIYFADVLNNRFRKITYPPTLTVPTISLSGTPSVPVGSMVTVTATVGSAGGSYIIHWMNHGIEFTTTTIPFLTYTKPAGVDTITARIIPTSYGCWDSTTSDGHIVAPDASLRLNSLSIEIAQISPNPATTSLTIKAPREITAISITNMMGQTVFSNHYHNKEVRIDVADLPAGMYLVRISGMEVRKFVKQ